MDVIKKGYPVMENDVAISISVSHVSKEHLQEIAKSIKDALNAKFNTPTIQEQ